MWCDYRFSLGRYTISLSSIKSLHNGSVGLLFSYCYTLDVCCKLIGQLSVWTFVKKTKFLSKLVWREILQTHHIYLY